MASLGKLAVLAFWCVIGVVVLAGFGAYAGARRLMEG